ncbi:hypothetical protein [Noviherbaspirillum sp. Root189]|uniref:hypothetical protein n=1 Tax=Noviherbaspirillum sp. Root189 TaxID=1736487 RepID=UPI001F262CBD|nr:hypothetical protein [Noviherbaspirillum sp. Root189]
MISKKITVVASVLLAVGLTACDIDKTKEGKVSLPKYEVEKTKEGSVKLPEYDVKTPDVTVKKEEKTVEVPTIKKEERTVQVPNVDVTSAKEK